MADMSDQTSIPPLIQTIGERCRVCFTCVRECPAKAIRIEDGQANVIGARCIGCGNCVKVCARNAKYVRSSTDLVRELQGAGHRLAAIVAPSFPAEFVDVDHRQVVGMLRKLGFDLVCEVAFGADLVAEEYRRLRHEQPDRRVIATTCPALVYYVEKYHPHLVNALAPIVSPMIAMARVLHHLHGEDLRVVFIGPCLAKKQEARDPFVAEEIAAALTFAELATMMEEAGLAPDAADASDFDGPHPGYGHLFPISRGMLQSARLMEDLITGDVVAADGRENFTQAVKEFESGALEAKLLEVLCCNGCIMGAGMTTTDPLFRRRARISRYARHRLAENPPVEPHEPIAVDLSRGYQPDDQRLRAPSDGDLDEILQRLGKFKAEDELNCGACGYPTCREHAVAIAKGLAESEMCLPYTIDRLKTTVEDLQESHEQLAGAQMALMQAERLASMGQLAAGIAHEVNNPLGVVLLYAHMLMDDCPADSPMRQDLETIVEESDRCKKIVAGLLNFARKNKLALKEVKLVDLVERCTHVHPRPETVTVTTKHLAPDLMLQLDPDQITQVLVNFVTNAVAAMPDGGSIAFETGVDGEFAYIKVSDTGTGIPKQNLNKIFEPFFTTKERQQGTGLGLAVTYGIVKMHRGRIDVTSNTDPAAGPTGTTFLVRIPLNLRTEEEGDSDSPEHL